MTRPAIFTLPPTLPFVDALAAGIVERIGEEPLALSRATVLLPTARAVRSLREAFLRLSDGRPVLLPRLAPLGEVDADDISLTMEGLAGSAGGLDVPPAISPLRRQLLLTQLVKKVPDLAATTAQAANLAKELAKLLDQVQTERLDFARLHDLVPEDYSEHWQITLKFLEILTELWPGILGELGLVDPAVERNARLAALAKAWEAVPPQGPVIAAGSTGSIPAAADLLAVVARLPQGCVVLPGLDLETDAATWAALDEAHPQYGLKQLLARLGVEWEEARPWPVPDHVHHRSSPARTRLLAEALRPAETTEAWRDLPPVGPEVLDNLFRLDAPSSQEEAGTIALMFRQVLETPGRTAALVTPDRNLARRVAMEMRRWGIEVDDSAGRPLAQTPVGSFLRLLADAAANPAPVPLLSLLKHPLAAAGMEGGEFKLRVRDLERAVFRGPRPAEGLDALRSAIELAEDRSFDRPALRGALVALVDRLRERMGPMLEAIEDGVELPLTGWLRLHIQSAEALAQTAEETGAARIWRHEDGEATARFIDELREAAHGFPALKGPDYAALIEVLMSGLSVRPRFGLHPRLHIFGLMEARLQQFDLVVLAGLNEGTWPPAPAADPWMSRPMRTRFGLPSPEQQIGQTAHDFAMAAGAGEVVLSRAQRVEGTPTVPSRWLLRLDAVLDRAGLAGRLRAPAARWLGIQAGLDWPAEVKPCAAPAPKPPVEARPRKLSVTQIETWMRDPYAIYARKVLNLQALEEIDADPGAAERGQILHQALDEFVRAWPDKLPADALDQLLAMGRRAFGPLLEQPGVYAFWWPRFEKVAQWFIGIEQERRRGGTHPLATEVWGKVELPGPAGPFTLTAKADRIDRLGDGGLGLVDYKTGTPPSPKEVRLGMAPQLPLEAVIAKAGGFDGVAAADVGNLAFWRLSGNDPAGEIKEVREDLPALAEEARAGLIELIRLFDDPDTAYASVPRPGWAPRYTDYAHLARVAEWSAGGGEE
ncbi:double-strand break repair protein AddB [Indioceanicola profundi]|uniref:double-strand break repair protein AddB n=1 Tax=Indioceanicola profundi TaxID=2220096 RepID=UPI000E6AAF94|nr:double-strand break repair protein AddB [Indioceanicola profundi]